MQLKEPPFEPESFWDMQYSLVKQCAKYFVQSFRLYVVYEGGDNDDVINQLKNRVKDWDKG